MDFETEELDQRVEGVEAELVTRFRWRANRRCRNLNNQRHGIAFYRFEVHPIGKKWEVVVMQNQAKPLKSI
jgi:hypothetical protein